MATVTKEIKGLSELLISLRKLGDKVPKVMQDVISVQSIALVTYLRLEKMRGGTSDTRLARRTGQLARQTRAKTPRVENKIIKGGITFGSAYAGVHIGKRGQVTTIRPKNSKYLTIPLPAAKTASGVLRGGARSSRWANTFVRKSKKGNLIIFGQSTSQSGAQAGGAKKKITPLFLLKKSVKVKARIYTGDLLIRTKRKITVDLRTRIKSLGGKI